MPRGDKDQASKTKDCSENKTEQQAATEPPTEFIFELADIKSKLDPKTGILSTLRRRDTTSQLRKQLKELAKSLGETCMLLAQSMSDMTESH